METDTIVHDEHELETYEVSKYTKSFGLSFAITSVFSALLVVLKETNEDTVLAWMKAATGHHWVTHGLVNLIVFFFLGWLLARSNHGQGVNISERSLIITIVAGLVIGGLILAGFYAVD
jgi:hypothetical protein